MKNEKTQTKRILDGFITSVILIFSITLITSGIAISKINTDYMETGIRAGKIVAEREAQQISVTTHDGLTLKGENNPETLKRIINFLPPPINTTYMMLEEAEKILIKIKNEQ